MSKDLPSKTDLWFLPLGGCGEIGMNMNLFGHDGQWLMVDCGVAFDKVKQANISAKLSSNRVICADPSFISHRRTQLQALIITHAHEDHIGAVPYLWPQLRCPIYTTAFTAAILHRKLAEFGLAQSVPVHIVAPKDRITIGSFDVEWFPLTHSIPEPQALVLRTTAGTVFHTADWKLDSNPVVGKGYSKGAFEQLANETISAMVCDSTNAATPGHSESESRVAEGLLDTVKTAQGRVVITCFGSNVARMQSAVRAAHSTGRYAGLLGRSLINMHRAAKATGYWPEELSLVEANHLGFLPPNEVLAVATGSQGEERTALLRLAERRHPDVDLDKGDMVIFSSKTIPGNEDAIKQLRLKLQALGVIIVDSDSSDLPVHATGHPCSDELTRVYGWVKPKLAIPVHGEPPHMQANAEIAKRSGVKASVTGKNGDLFVIAPQTRVRRRFCQTGVLDLTQSQ